MTTKAAEPTRESLLAAKEGHRAAIADSIYKDAVERFRQHWKCPGEDSRGQHYYNINQPPAGTRLLGVVSEIYYRTVHLDDEKQKLLTVEFQAFGNVGKEAQYNGLKLWRRYPFESTADGAWDKFLQAFELTFDYLYEHGFTLKSGSSYAHDQYGRCVMSFAGLEVGSVDFWCEVITKDVGPTYSPQRRAAISEWVRVDESRCGLHKRHLCFSEVRQQIEGDWGTHENVNIHHILDQAFDELAEQGEIWTDHDEYIHTYKDEDG